MALANRKFVINEIIFAKVTGYAPWPAFIKQIDGNHAMVTFISKKKETNRIHNTKLTPLLASAPILKAHMDKNAEFSKSVREVRILLTEKKHELATKFNDMIEASSESKTKKAVKKTAPKHKGQPKTKYCLRSNKTDSNNVYNLRKR